ncbi:MAG: DUF3999 domain-containing protein [Proteobacteria bacterium]|nr:DUF3999 domain-containing protein [Cystobacterineae bacterium]MCL2314073.1 DUF3999 domain-containing protein [Pseudomonadota bacterium]
MRRTGSRGLTLFSVLLAFPMAVHAGIREDYAQQWVLNLPTSEGGIYQLLLSEEIYEKVQSPQLLDVEAFNAQGQALPTEFLKWAEEEETSSKTVELPWFVLPQGPQKGGKGEDIAVLVQRNADGSLKLADIAKAPGAAASSWLVDASGQRGRLRMLSLEWSENAEPFEQHVSVEGSNDLRQWHMLASKAPILHLSKGGQALRHNRIELSSGYRYLRLRAESAEPKLPLVGLRAEFVSQAAAPQRWQWRDLQGKRIEEGGQAHYEFELEGRFPIERVDVLAGSNSTQRWVLQSRDTPEAAWHTRTAPWVAYVVQAGGAEIRSPAQALEGICRERHWRLVSDTLPDKVAAPTLRLFYRPEALVFMLQGEAPYALAVGSNRARRMPSSLLQTIEALRQQKAAHWQPATAKVGQVEILAGDEALQPLLKQEEGPKPGGGWKQWVLWGILLGGAMVVVVFAVRLLKGTPEEGSPSD